MKFSTFILLSLLFISCQTSFGDKYTIENFEIFYGEGVDREYVRKTGIYFRDHGLLQDHKHSAQLLYDPSKAGYELRLVLNPEYESLPGEMIKDLLLLEEDMKHAIFGDLNFILVVCDKNFNPIK